jgi:hypothetical protein
MSSLSSDLRVDFDLAGFRVRDQLLAMPVFTFANRHGWPITPVLLAALLSSAASAQQRGRPATDSALRSSGELIGLVLDAAGQPMAQVEVYIAGTDRVARSDTRGRWRFADPPAGPHVVVARRSGYVPYVREVVIGSQVNDTLSLLLRRFPTALSAIQVNARSLSAQADAASLAERLMQIRVGTGRLFTRDDILRMRPHSIAEMIFGVPGIAVTTGQTDIVVTSTRAGVGIMNVEGQACQLQFYWDNTPISNEGVRTLDPMTFRSVEVYPQAVLLTGLPMRHDKCGAIVINSLRR